MNTKDIITAANEKWIVDRFAQEYRSYKELDPKVFCIHDMYYKNTDPLSLITLPEQREAIGNADLWWCMADWTYVSYPNMDSKPKKIVSCHHFVKEKFSEQMRAHYQVMNEQIDLFHVPCQYTADFLMNEIGVNKEKIFIQPFWINNDIFYDQDIQNIDIRRDEIDLRLKGKFVIFSAVRDTEGFSANSKNPQPKREKGPQHFVEIVKNINDKRGDVCVLLAGWRRQYVIKKFEEYRIPYIIAPDRSHPDNYLETSNLKINQYYNISDLVINPAEVEGGPMSVPESAITKTPIISTKTGVADVFLDKNSLYDFSDYNAWEKCLENAQNPKIIEENYKRAMKYSISFKNKKWEGFEPFRNMIRKVKNG